MLIDIGSTTSDIVPLVHGLPTARGRTDPERLVSGELVYTGVERSPVAAVASRVPWKGWLCPLAQELFATTRDVYLLLGDLPLEQAMQTSPLHPNVDVLPAGYLPPNPSELLASAKMKALIEELARRYDVVILDTPAALSLPDAKTVTELTDGAVMVVRADTTPESDVQTALDLIDRRRVLGVVLNGSAVDQTYYSYR